jgi:hypothetical protein
VNIRHRPLVRHINGCIFTEIKLRFDYRTFHIDCTARHDEDGLFQAHARITCPPDDRSLHVQVFDSGELDSFATESDALQCARSWAIEWCDEMLAGLHH